MAKYYFLLSLFFPLITFSQNNPNELIDNGANKDNLEKTKAPLIIKMAELRTEFDEANFNYAIAVSDNAELYENEEKFKRSQKVILEIVRLSSMGLGLPKDDVLNLNEAGELLYASNKYKLAEESFRKAMKICETNNLTQDPLYATLMGNLGLLYHTTHRFTLSQKYTDSCLHLRQRILPLESSPIAATINNLAVLYKDMGRFQEAEEQILEALRINEKALHKKSVAYALSMNNQAMIYLAMGKYREVESILQESQSIASESLKEKSTSYSKLMLNLAVFYQLSGRLADAEVIYLKIVKLKEKKLGTSHPDYAHIMDLLASHYLDMGKEKYGDAENLLKKSVAINKKIFQDTHPNYALAISNLGNFYRISGKPANAEPLLKEALEINKIELGLEHPEYVNSVENLGLLYWQLGKNIEASKLLKESADKTIKEIDNYFTPLSEIEKTKFWDKIKPRFQRFSAFAIHVRKSMPALGFDMYNYHLTTKALILNATHNIKQQILLSKEPEVIKKYMEWLDAKENLARLYMLNKIQLAEERINLDSLENAASSRERELAVKSPAFAKGYSKIKITHKNIVEKLSVDEAAIEIVQLQKFQQTLTDSVQYVALILSKDKAAGGLEIVLMPNGGEMEKKYFNSYKAAIKQKTNDDHSYKHYWERMEKYLTNKKTLYISVDGIFNQINLGTLQLPSGQYLIDHKNIIMLTNAKDIIAYKNNTAIEDHKAHNAVLVGYPLYGSKGTVERLPGTKMEVETLKRILQSKPYNTTEWMQEEANEGNIKSLKNPKVLHIATHGYFVPDLPNAKADKLFGISLDKSNENPLLRSGLLLADAEKAIIGKSDNGILTTYEISKLSLNNTSVVALSACETNHNEGKYSEGVYGLQRAFKVAGAEAIIMTLWEVNDTATQDFMSTFYKSFIANGNKHKSFKEAQQSLKEKNKEPFYWGSYVLVE